MSLGTCGDWSLYAVLCILDVNFSSDLVEFSDWIYVPNTRDIMYFCDGFYYGYVMF
jgi:hypothetical protein